MATITLSLPDTVARIVDERAREAAFDDRDAFLGSVIEDLFAPDHGQINAAIAEALRLGDESPDSPRSSQDILDEVIRKP